ETFSVTPRQVMPFWAKLTVGGLVTVMAGGLGYVAEYLEWGGGVQTLLSVLTVAGGPVAVVLVGLLYLSPGRGISRALETTPALIWARALVGFAAALGGAILGASVGRDWPGGWIGWTLGTAIGSGLFGIVAWHLMTLLYLLVAEGAYRVPM